MKVCHNNSRGVDLCSSCIEDTKKREEAIELSSIEDGNSHLDHTTSQQSSLSTSPSETDNTTAPRPEDAPTRQPERSDDDTRSKATTPMLKNAAPFGVSSALQMSGEEGFVPASRRSTTRLESND